MSEEISAREHFVFQPQFLEKLKSDPEGALKLMGIAPTEGILAALDAVDEKTLRQMADLAIEVADQHPQMVWP